LSTGRAGRGGNGKGVGSLFEKTPDPFPLPTEVFPDGKGGGTIRVYGPDGKAKTDYDFGHDHTGAGEPHAHDWDWSKTEKPRGKPRPLRPGE
jgi:hypothetical protein